MQSATIFLDPARKSPFSPRGLSICNEHNILDKALPASFVCDDFMIQLIAEVLSAMFSKLDEDLY